uniref:Strawberry notch helicase C domain-containing protein n=1 Tax=Acrobeloides nanus TaxID=290746 RepID=A0A914DFZ9_9BILA
MNFLNINKTWQLFSYWTGPFIIWGASFSVEEVPLSTEFIKLYDDSVKFWIECKRQFQYALKLLNVQQKKLSQNVWAQFWAAHQRFFKYLCIGAKVDATVRIAQEAIRQKKCVVIGLQSTGESQTIEAMDNMDGDLMDFVSTTKAVLYNLIDKHFPTGDSNSGSGDALKDLDRVFSIGEGGSSSSRKRRHEDDYYGFSLKKLKQMGYDPSSASNSAKNSDNEEDDKNTESENSSNEDDETDDEDNEESSDESNADEEKDELMNTLLAEIEEEESLEEDIDVPNEDIENADISDGPSQEDMDGVEINPFCMDFGRGHDPWARQQTIVVERQKEQQVEIKIKEKKNKKKKKTKDQSLTDFMKKERAEMAEKREETTQNADEFIKSTRFIENSTPFVSRDDITEHLTLIKAELLTAVEKLGPSLPPNTLDQLIDRLGGPENVAEMTGRRGRVVVSKNGDVEYQLRNSNSEVSVEMMNMEEKDKFMRGDKLVAIISEAASSGISLQADKRAPNKRKRVHITLELPWSADKAVQQFGRTHRSNQAHAPEYLFLISELSGEKRFASTVAKRLASLGALTHGDRRATDSRDLSQFNIDTKYGRMALDAMLHTIIGVGTPVSVQPPSDYKGGDFFQDMRKYLEGVGMLIKLPNGSYIIEKENTQITKFLNRILGLPVHAQNSLFQYFNDIISALIAEAKQDGTYDQGIMDLGVGGDRVQEHESKEFMGVANGIPFKVNLHKIGVERGVSWEEALSIYEKHKGEKDGFYIHTNPRSKRTMIALIHGVGKNLQPGAEATMYCIIRPNTGRSPKLGNFADLSHRFRPSTLEQAEKAWKEQFTGMDNMCMHKFLFGICRADSAHNFCEVGRRKRNYFVLSGSVLTIWPFVEEALNKGRPMARTSGSRMQVVRIRTESGQKIVGILVLADYVQRLVEILQSKCHGINVDNFLKQK